MGLLILLAIGGILGWLTIIIVMESDDEAVFTTIASGSVGALAAGLAITPTSLIDTLTLPTLLFASIGAIVAAILGYYANRALVNRDV